ncbi:fatty acid desaturase [Poronia punctata]|nr:fatty acid desaturase [Poronia punctata]
MDSITINPGLTPVDRLVLRNLASSIRNRQPTAVTARPTLPARGSERNDSEAPSDAIDAGKLAGNKPDGQVYDQDDDGVISTLQELNQPLSEAFEPTVFSTWDLGDIRRYLPPAIYRHILLPYISWAQGIARYQTDVVMVTHLILYFSTTLPSALFLFYRFSYWHGIFHILMQGWYCGAYTLLRHQHIHQRGVLAKRSWMQLFDQIFPYVMDPLMGHTWNSYFYHHVKHHHIEGNGPDDLSSTIRYQRDNVWHFLHYVGRFYFLVWFDLPLYFVRKGKLSLGMRAGFWDVSSYVAIVLLLRLNFKAALFTHLIPLLIMRLGLMAGNWGQHAFVDPVEPDSDYRSSVTLIDISSNRYCYNDGYHTSHHLNPLRHWREHPVHFLQNKETYSHEGALVFHEIDYLMITIRLLMRDYEHLARCLVPIGDQMDLTMEQRVEMLKDRTRPLSEEEIRTKFGVVKNQ